MEQVSVESLEASVAPLAYLDEVIYEDISGAHWMLCQLITWRWALISSVSGEIQGVEAN